MEKAKVIYISLPIARIVLLAGEIVEVHGDNDGTVYANIACPCL